MPCARPASSTWGLPALHTLLQFIFKEADTWCEKLLSLRACVTMKQCYIEGNIVYNRVSCRCETWSGKSDVSLFSVSPEMAFQKHSHKTAIASRDTSFPKERKCPSFGRLRILGYASLRGDHPLQRAQSVPSFSPLSSPLCILPSLGPKWRHCRPQCSTEPVQRLSCTDLSITSATGNGWWASNRKRTYIRATSREAMCCSFNSFH